MKEKNKGAISIFALLSMMFFLIFIMVAYNNVVQKGKVQGETQGILSDYYKSAQTAAEVITAKKGTTNVSTGNSSTLLKETAQQGKVSGNSGKFIFSNGKVYTIQ